MQVLLGICLQDLEEFRMLALELVKSAFSFNGQETVDVLDLWQLNLLRSHRWERRIAEVMNEGEQFDNRQNVLDARKGEFDADKQGEDVPAVAASQAEDDIHEPMYRMTREQKTTLASIRDAINTICTRLFIDDHHFLDKAGSLMDEDGDIAGDLVSFTLELKARLQKRLLEERDIDESGEVELEILSAMDSSSKGQSRSKLREEFSSPHVNKDDKMHTQEVDCEIEAVSSTASLNRQISRRQTINWSCLGKSDETYAQLIHIERYETELKRILMELVLDIAFKMQKEGMIAAPPLV